MDRDRVARCRCGASLRGRMPRQRRLGHLLSHLRVIRLSRDQAQLQSLLALRANEVSTGLYRLHRPRQAAERLLVERRAKLPLMPVPRVPPPPLPPVPMPERQLLRPAIALRRPPRPRSPITVRVESRLRTFSAVKTRSTRPPLRRRPLDWVRVTPPAGDRRASGHWLRRLPLKMLLPTQPVRI